MQTPTNHVFYTMQRAAEFLIRLAATLFAYLPLGTLEWTVIP